MKQLCWGLALLALVQPSLSFDCPCVCDSRREGILTSEETAANHCHQGGSPCCHHDHKDLDSDVDSGNSKCLSLLALVEIHRCNCPSDCDCQWRHSSARTAAIRSRTEDHTLRLVKPVPDCAYVSKEPLPQELPETLRQLEGLHPISAQSACALLCRFLS